MNRNTYIQETTAIQRRYEAKYFPKVRDEIQDMIDVTSGIVQLQGAQAAIDDLNKQLSNTNITAIIQQLALDVGLRFARRQWTSLQQQRREAKGFGFNEAWVNWIKTWLYDFIVRTISFQVFQTTKDVLLRVLSQAITEGLGVKETVKLLDELDLSENQAARIVRTEITRATNAGTAAAAETFPFQQKKEWISAHDLRVRNSLHASHVLLDGQAVDYEDVFRDPINGQELRWPGDPLAPAAETINCRCTHAVTAKLDENGDLIDKPVSTVIIYPSRRQRQTILI